MIIVAVTVSIIGAVTEIVLLSILKSPFRVGVDAEKRQAMARNGNGVQTGNNGHKWGITQRNIRWIYRSPCP